MLRNISLGDKLIQHYQFLFMNINNKVMLAIPLYEYMPSLKLAIPLHEYKTITIAVSNSFG